MATVEYINDSYYYDDDDSPSWTKDNNYRFTGFITDDKGASGVYGITLPPDTKLGQVIYFVYVLYNTGDSFGQETDAMIDIGVYKTIEEAKDVKSAIEKNVIKLNTTSL